MVYGSCHNQNRSILWESVSKQRFVFVMVVILDFCCIRQSIQFLSDFDKTYVLHNSFGKLADNRDNWIQPFWPSIALPTIIWSDYGLSTCLFIVSYGGTILLLSTSVWDVTFISDVLVIDLKRNGVYRTHVMYW